MFGVCGKESITIRRRVLLNIIYEKVFKVILFLKQIEKVLIA
jgi:hypothetical protein